MNYEDPACPAVPDGLPLFLTVPEVAELLRTTEKAIYIMAGRDRIPGVVRVGRRLLVRRDEKLAWLHRSRASSPKEATRR